MACCGKRPRSSTPEEPILIGEADGGEVIRARVTLGMDGLRAGQIGWFTGSTVETLIAKKILVPV